MSSLICTEQTINLEHFFDQLAIESFYERHRMTQSLHQCEMSGCSIQFAAAVLLPGRGHGFQGFVVLIQRKPLHKILNSAKVVAFLAKVLVCSQSTLRQSTCRGECKASSERCEELFGSLLTVRITFSAISTRREAPHQFQFVRRGLSKSGCF